MKAKIVSMETEMVGVPYSYKGSIGHYGLNAVTKIDFLCFDEFGKEFKVKLEGERIFSLDPNSEFELEIKIKEVPKLKAREFVLK